MKLKDFFLKKKSNAKFIACIFQVNSNLVSRQPYQHLACLSFHLVVVRMVDFPSMVVRHSPLPKNTFSNRFSHLNFSHLSGCRLNLCTYHQLNQKKDHNQRCFVHHFFHLIFFSNFQLNLFQFDSFSCLLILNSLDSNASIYTGVWHSNFIQCNNCNSFNKHLKIRDCETQFIIA